MTTGLRGPLKQERQAKILEIVQRRRVTTQHELVAALQESGIEATQATISRDLKELALIKVPTGDGRYCYALGQETAGPDESMRGTVLDVAVSENLVVVRTLAESATRVARLIETKHWPEVLATLVSPPYVLLVVRPKQQAEAVAARLRRLLP